MITHALSYKAEDGDLITLITALPLTLKTALAQIMLYSYSKRRMWGRNRLILKCYCTKIVVKSAKSMFIMQDAS